MFASLKNQCFPELRRFAYSCYCRPIVSTWPRPTGLNNLKTSVLESRIIGPTRKVVCAKLTAPFVVAKCYATVSNMEGGPRKKASGDAEPSRKMTRTEAAVAERERYLNMPLSDKRRTYRCGQKFKTISNVPTWPEYYDKHKDRLLNTGASKSGESVRYEVNDELNDKVSMWKGDITSLEIDSIVNAANSSLMGGGGVDGAIHDAAGSALKRECSSLGGCDTGDAKLSGGFKLPARYIIHTVGPIGGNSDKLRSCYKTCLKIMKDKKLRSTAFPCISTGIYGFPNEDAVHVALKTAREFLQEHGNKVDRIIFCLFMKVDVMLYEEYMQEYFPISDKKDPETEKTKQVQSASVENTESEKESASDVKENKGSVPVPEKTKSLVEEPHVESETQNEDGSKQESHMIAESTEGPKSSEKSADDCSKETAGKETDMSVDNEEPHVESKTQNEDGTPGSKNKSHMIAESTEEPKSSEKSDDDCSKETAGKETDMSVDNEKPQSTKL